MAGPTIYDVAQASAFYCSTLGFEETYRNEDEHGVEFAFLALEPYGIGLGRRNDGVRMVTAWSTSTADVDHVVGVARFHGSKYNCYHPVTRG